MNSCGTMMTGAGSGTEGTTQTGGETTTNDAISVLGSILGNVLGLNKLTEADLYGTWKYSQPGCAFTTEQLLQKAGGEVVAADIKTKVKPYYDKAGVSSSNTQITFTEDGKFSANIAGKQFSGTYTYDEASGEVHDADGTLKGTIGKDFVEVSGIGKVSILGEKGGLSLDGTTTIGRATTYDCTIYGTQMGSLSQNEPRELVAFFFLSECAADKKSTLAELRGAHD